MSITLVIIILTGLISYNAFSNRDLFERMKHYPIVEHSNKEYHRLLTSGFVHADMTHLFINMYVLFIFGEYVELQFQNYFGPLMGRVNYTLLYVLAIIGADLPTYAKHKHNPRFASVGASGAISAVLFAFILMNPWSQLLLFFIIPMPAIVAGILFLVWESYASKKNYGRIDHDGHFYGAIFGIIFMIIIRPSIIPDFLEKIVSIF
ncbi:MAG: rhomboid family intramembrane serine protease [Bacteroidia bacterium]|nr:rhomboid family intramembrane serine protease [Bacteroidia bacterium]